MKPPTRTTEQEHAMARVSALHTVKSDGAHIGVSVADVCRRQGLCTIRARLALKQLTDRGEVTRIGTKWFPLAECDQ